MQFRLTARTFALVCLFVITSIVQGQTQRTFVASNGLDTNPCSRTAPCRTFAAAAAQTLSQGEVIVLDSAGYGPVSLTQAVSLVAPPGVYAGITAFVGDAVSVNAPSSAVALRGLTLNSLGADNGVNVASVGELHVDRCLIANFNIDGVQFATAGDLFVDDSTVNYCLDGVRVLLTAGTAYGSLDHVRFEEDSDGLLVNATGATAKVTVRDTSAVRMGGSGFYAFNGTVNLKNCVVANGELGVRAAAGGTVVVEGSMITDNVFGFYNGGGNFLSAGNNVLHGNGTPTTGTITPLTPQ